VVTIRSRRADHKHDRTIRCVVAVALVVTLRACNASRDDDAGRDCTAAGCIPGIQLDYFGDAPTFAALGVDHLELCLADNCQQNKVDRKLAIYRLTGYRPGQHVDLQIRLLLHDGRVVTRRVRGITLEAFRPNGPRCGPVCPWANLGIYDGFAVRQMGHE
jgi:hypothetical protein